MAMSDSPTPYQAKAEPFHRPTVAYSLRFTVASGMMILPGARGSSPVYPKGYAPSSGSLGRHHRKGSYVVTLKTFFDEAREGRLTGLRCQSCGELTIPPKEFCASCREHSWEVVRLSGDGVISSFTIIRVPPKTAVHQPPYAVAVVRLKEGVSLLGRMVDVPLESLAVGREVSFRPLVSGEQTLIAFAPRTSP